MRNIYSFPKFTIVCADRFKSVFKHFHETETVGLFYVLSTLKELLKEKPLSIHFNQMYNTYHMMCLFLLFSS